MKKNIIKLASVLFTAVIATSVGVAVAVTPPAVPAEQQALLDAGYTKKADYGLFVKQDGNCKITVQKSGKNYYVTSKGKFGAQIYPVQPSQVLNAANLINANCQA